MKVLDMMTYTVQCQHAKAAGEGTNAEIDIDGPEELHGDHVGKLMRDQS